MLPIAVSLPFVATYQLLSNSAETVCVADADGTVHVKFVPVYSCSSPSTVKPRNGRVGETLNSIVSPTSTTCADSAGTISCPSSPLTTLTTGTGVR